MLTEPSNFFMARYLTRVTCEPYFERMFSVRFDSFWGVTGFDVVKFGDWLQVDPESDQSTEDVVRERYGDEAVRLVLALIDMSQFVPTVKLPRLP